MRRAETGAAPDTPAQRPLQGDLALAAALALGVMLVMLALYWPAIAALGFRDGDDALRLVQVSDLLAGQSWFDTTQHRINPPAGGLMHWSRLIDAPIAGLILLLRPVLGAQLAEQWVLALYPPLLLLPLFLSMAWLLRRLSAERQVLLFGLLLTASAVTSLHYFVPLRIDHHGWQTILSVLMLAIALGAADRRHGLLAGLAMSAHVAISLEALPYLLIFGAIFALAWLRDAAAGPRFLTFVATFAIGAPLLLLATRGLAGVSGTWCDAWSWPYLAATLAAACALLGGAVIPVVARDWRARLAMMALAGAIGALLFIWQGKACLGGPFGALEPLVRDYWYANVLEGQPLWRQSAASLAMLLAPSLAAFILTLRLWFGAEPGPVRARWEIMALVLGASTLLSLLVARTTAVTHLYALPALAVSGVAIWRHGRSRQSATARIAASLAVLLVIPAVIGGLAHGAAGLVAPETTVEATRTAPPCPTRGDLAQLAGQPPGLVLAAIDIAPMVLVHTPHSVVASGHHRNHAAMERVIAALSAPPAHAEAAVRATRADWLLICPDQPEITNIAKDFPMSLAARLRAGATPGWLQAAPPTSGSAMRLYRIIPAPQAGSKSSARPLMQ